MNKNTKRQASRAALSQKRYDKQLFIISDFEVSSGKTRDAAKILKSLEAKSFLIVGNLSEETQRSLLNLPKVKSIPAEHLNVRDLLKHQRVLLTEAALNWIQENLKTEARAA